MAYDKPIWLTSSFVDDDEISKVVLLADLDEVFKNVATSVDSRRVRQNQLKLFLEADQPLAGVTARRDEELRVAILCVLVLIVNVRASHDSLVVCQLEVLLNLFFISLELSRHTFVVVKRVLHLESTVLLLLLRELLLLCVEVLLSQPNVLSNHFNY